MKNDTTYHPIDWTKSLWPNQIAVFVSAAFISLLDNYESDTGEPEIVTPEEVAENHKFLDSIIQTPTMKVPAVEFGNKPSPLALPHQCQFL